MSYHKVAMSNVSAGEVLFVGGFNTGKRALRYVARAAEEMGAAGKVRVITFADSMQQPQKLREWKDDIWTHSAGELALAQALPPALLAGYARLTAFNGPEVVPASRLVALSRAKTLHHITGVLFGPAHKGHAITLGSQTAELSRHPRANLRHLGRVSRFSTIDYLSTSHAAGNNVRAVMTTNDDYYPHAQHIPVPYPTVTIEGSHDRLLVEPQAVLAALAMFALKKTEPNT